MSKDTSICFDIGTIKPQEKKVLDICVLVDENKKYFCNGRRNR